MFFWISTILTEVIKPILDSCFKSSTVVTWRLKMLSFTVPQSELSHVIRSGLQGGHIISDQCPIHHPLNLSTRHSLTGRA